MPNYNQEHKDLLDKKLLDYPMVRAGKMFGYPAYYVGKKMAICLVEDGVGIKLPYEKAQALLDNDPHVTHFQPHGRQKMREWVQINLDASEGYSQYQTVLEDSINYVLSLNH